jgi:hypothetical protein
VILDQDDEGQAFGLIDVADMRIAAGPLSVQARARNFMHLTRYEADRSKLQEFGLDRFIDCYLAAAELTIKEGQSFVRKIRRRSPFFESVLA